MLLWGSHREAWRERQASWELHGQSWGMRTFSRHSLVGVSAWITINFLTGVCHLAPQATVCHGAGGLPGEWALVSAALRAQPGVSGPIEDMEASPTGLLAASLVSEGAWHRCLFSGTSHEKPSFIDYSLHTSLCWTGERLCLT